MKTALIGSTGFVGGNLLRDWKPDEEFHSTNIEEVVGQRFSLVVCAGTYAEKWRINQSPEPDRANVARLEAMLARSQIERLVLLSTVDVYPVPIGVDEATQIDERGLSPYGLHRLWLERQLAGRFKTLIVRLPALFGTGIKKNVIFDLLHANQVDRINPGSTFQFYDLRRLWSDISIALEGGLSLLNLATEPIAVREVAETVFGFDEFAPTLGGAPARYDVRTRHAPTFGPDGPYLMGRNEVLARLATFVDEERVASRRATQ